MIPVKNERELEVMRRACKITAAARALAGEMVRPGVTTKQIDKAVHDFILSQGAKPTFLGYGGFPASTCISINEVMIHGIPGNRVLKEGDIVSVDVGATWGGFTGDCAATFACGAISPTAQKLITVTEQSFYEGIKFARQGNRISDIGHAVQTYVESQGFGVVRAFVGHGVGEKMHEEPEVPNYGSPGRGPRMVKGMTLAIEPMVTQGSYDVRVLKDGWTTVTADGKLAAHYENSILITDGEPEILTVTLRDCKLWKLTNRAWSSPKAGRDKGQLFYVIDTDEQYVYLADGKSRKLEKPKRKKRKHVQQVPRTESRIAEKIRNGEKVLNSELRKELASRPKTKSKPRGLIDLGKRRRNRT